MDGVFGLLHPAVAAWCDEHLGAPTQPQAAALPLSRDGRHTLICSPTGTGKTLAAFLPVMSRLAELRDADELLARTYCLYVSPLRALGYDVEHNLRRPLREMGLRGRDWMLREFTWDSVGRRMLDLYRESVRAFT